MFEVELCKVFIRRLHVEVKVSVTLLESVFVWVYLKLRPWWSAPRLPFGQQQDIHTKGGIFLKMSYTLFVSSDLSFGVTAVIPQKIWGERVSFTKNYIKRKKIVLYINKTKIKCILMQSTLLLILLVCLISLIRIL
jgi:hypothetical protein